MWSDAFEGPPSADDMQCVVRKMLVKGERKAALHLADVMSDHLMRDHGASGRYFYWWLGVMTAVDCLEVAK